MLKGYMTPLLLFGACDRLNGWRRTDKKNGCCRERTEHDPCIARMEAWGAIRLVGRLMLLINDDQANFTAQRAQRNASAHHEVWPDLLQSGMSIQPLTLARP
jgi:hypothetical protein